MFKNKKKNVVFKLVSWGCTVETLLLLVVMKLHLHNLLKAHKFSQVRRLHHNRNFSSSVSCGPQAEYCSPGFNKYFGTSL